MILSAEELGILEYLKSWSGKFIPMIEISRRAAGRRRFEEEPHWAKGLVSRLVDAKLVEVNERGHYRVGDTSSLDPDGDTPAVESAAQAASAPPDNENYFPSAAAAATQFETTQWFSPEIAAILKRSAKKSADPPPG